MEKFIAQVREAGARIALDDFGSALQQLCLAQPMSAPSYLKIDGRFVQAWSTQGANTTDHPHHQRARPRTRHAMHRRRRLKMTRRCALLKHLGADYGQGWRSARRCRWPTSRPIAPAEGPAGAASRRSGEQARRTLGGGSPPDSANGLAARADVPAQVA